MMLALAELTCATANSLVTSRSLCNAPIKDGLENSISPLVERHRV
jgi:hypothetical protein